MITVLVISIMRTRRIIDKTLARKSEQDLSASHIFQAAIGSCPVRTFTYTQNGTLYLDFWVGNLTEMAEEMVLMG